MFSRVFTCGWIMAACLAAALPDRAPVKTVENYSRDMELERVEGGLRASFGCPEVYSDWVRKRLSSGFTYRLLVQVQLKERGVKMPIAQGVMQYIFRYYIFDEYFIVWIERLGSREQLKLKSMDELVTRFGSVHDVALMGQSDLDPDKQYRVKARVVVNPTSPDIRKKVREYMANPDGNRSFGTPDSIFGRYSGMFVNEKDLQADAVLTYRSPWQLPASWFKKSD
jgi:hypothetical protein